MIQLQTLNYILDKKDTSLITLNNLNEDFFSDYRKEFNFIKDHINKYNVVCDKETFLDKFPDFDIVNVNEPADYLIKGLFEDYNKRALAVVFGDIRTCLMKDKTDEAMSIFNKASENMVTGVSLNCVDITKDTSRYNAYIERTQDFNRYYVTTGFKELDDVVGGFDKEEELATIVARTNYGKSWILLKCALAAVEAGLNVGMYSGEMSERKVAQRFDTLFGGISNKAITHGNINVQNEYKEYFDKKLLTLKGSLKVLTPKMINGPATVDALRAFIEKEKLDVLYIDQLSLLEDQRKGKTPIEKMGNISRDLKNLQVLKRIPIISVSQQNRTTTEDKISDTTQIAQSDRIGQDSTMIIFIERDKKDPSVMKLVLVKSRDSENGKTLTYNVDLNVGRFTYVPDEDDANGGRTEEDYSSKYNEMRYNDSCGNRDDSF